jgi:SAM-dependent methyltransferase
MSDHDLPFTDYPRCALCGADDAEPFMTANPRTFLVRCRQCQLVYTSPRADESKWLGLLKDANSQRNITFTTNRLRHGVAITRNIPRQRPDWRERMEAAHRALIAKLRTFCDTIDRIHDVGCGVGFFITNAKAAGLYATGNDLNAYACQVMTSQLGLDVFCGMLSEMAAPAASRDAVTMMDYIEHTYHPQIDLAEAFRILRPGGVLYIHTFRIDSKPFEIQGADWNMLKWNHVYHFSSETLTRMIENAGFEIAKLDRPKHNGLIGVVALKPGVGPTA